MRVFRRYISVCLLAILVIAVSLAVWCFAPASKRASYRVVSVPRGADALRVGLRLKEKGIIRSARAFSIVVRLMRAGEKLKAGDYRLSPHMSLPAIVKAIAEGESVTAWVTFPEGYTVQQMGEVLEKHGVVRASEFAKAVESGHGFRVNGYHFPERLEGYLFPDTYSFPKDASARDVVETMLRNFVRKVAAPLAPEFARAEARGMSMAEVITLASLVEREAKLAEERPVIAGVLANRLRKGMPLQCDATVQYALGEHHQRILYRDLDVDSPYNTYKHTGLPPGPICNPGIASIKAALSPAATRFLYYVAKPDGSHIFSATYEEHLRAKRQAARLREGH